MVEKLISGGTLIRYPRVFFNFFVINLRHSLVILQVVNGFDHTTQTWKFYSKFPREVCKDMHDPGLTKNGRKHLEYAAMSFREDFYLSFEPKPSSEVCNCQVINFLYECVDFVKNVDILFNGELFIILRIF